MRAPISIKTWLAFFLLCTGPFAFADATSEGWTWGVGCPGDGTAFTGGNFGASTSGGFSSSGTCSRTSTHFTQFSFASSSGGTLNSSTLYGIHAGNLLVIPPTLTTEAAPVYLVVTQCPLQNKTLNWLFIQWDSGTRTMADTYLLGTATYSMSSGINVTSQYDVTGAAYWLGTTPMPGSCDTGRYDSNYGLYIVSGQSAGDVNGTVYFGYDGSGVFKTSLGHATFFFPQYSITAPTDLGNRTYAGISFDSYRESDTRNTHVTSNSAGTQFTVQPYSDPSAGTIDSSYTDTVTITQVNFPANGMMVGTVTRSTAGTGNVACIVNRSVDIRIICSGQSPANTSYPYTLTFIQEGVHALGQARHPNTFRGDDRVRVAPICFF